jgi:hypothetical protein
MYFHQELVYLVHVSILFDARSSLFARIEPYFNVANLILLFIVQTY